MTCPNCVYQKLGLETVSPFGNRNLIQEQLTVRWFPGPQVGPHHKAYKDIIEGTEEDRLANYMPEISSGALAETRER